MRRICRQNHGSQAILLRSHGAVGDCGGWQRSEADLRKKDIMLRTFLNLFFRCVRVRTFIVFHDDGLCGASNSESHPGKSQPVKLSGFQNWEP